LADCTLDRVDTPCPLVFATIDAGAGQYTFYVSGTGTTKNGVTTSFGFNCNVDAKSVAVDCAGTSALPAPGWNPYWSNNAIAEIVGIPTDFNLPLSGTPTLSFTVSPPSASVGARKPQKPIAAPMSAKPGSIECLTNPGASVDAMNARNGNQPGADPDFPSQIYANGNRGTRQLNPDGDAEASGYAVLLDYAISVASCGLGILWGR
jgi:hypothetical protein